MSVDNDLSTVYAFYECSEVMLKVLPNKGIRLDPIVVEEQLDMYFRLRLSLQLFACQRSVRRERETPERRGLSCDVRSHARATKI